MDCSWVREQLEAYALGALDPDNHRTVEQHLAGCADCQRLADELVAAADLIPLALAAAAPVNPPAALKDRVLHAVQTSSNSTPQTTAGARLDIRPAEPPANDANDDRGATRSAVVAAIPTWRRPRSLVAIAAGLILVLTLAWGVRLSEALDRERAMRESVEDHFSQQQEIVLEVVDSDETVRVVLRPSDADSRSYGKLFTRLDLPHVVVMAARLPAPPNGQTYHVWLTSGGRTFLAGVLPVNEQGFGLLTFDADSNGPTYDSALLTLQSPGDSAPAGETILAWDASAP